MAIKFLITNLLLNLLFFIVGVLIYAFFRTRRNQQKPYLHVPLFILLGNIVAILCVSVSTGFDSGFHSNLRSAIIPLATLLGGPIGGGSTLLVMNSHRFFFNTEVALYFIISVSMFSLTLAVRPYWLQLRLGNRLVFANILVLFSSFVWLVSSIPTFQLDIPLGELVIYLLCNVLGTSIVIYLINVVSSQQKLKARVIETEKAQMLSEMAASISHEIRNPLTSTKGFLQLLQNDSLSKKEEEFYIKLALDGIDQANNVITDYLTFAKPATISYERILLQEEIRRAVRFVTPLASASNITIKAEYSLIRAYTYGEKQRFHQCLLNILKNSIEAMPTGGTLSISLRVEQFTPSLLITDTGIGMNEEQLNRLGSPFYSTKEKGTGLGMMVVFSILQAMNAKLAISSKQNDGTSIHITFARMKKVAI
ncbi:sensor histidine kinase [Priestia taiwanensis]|uniref:histidine kinase n=1 Tax=Priestia taiwanensis TaxID=1347902 RepID=A0A917AU86_9BACI|nr:HAMP domain-containing sensor histidine kinase [Priestia taiwanensis]MBM7363995.1 two-component system sporulation sensor kinase B [Priestia taiwanensis]GGE70822.1 sporulation kinase [Priestia taiwanensis]